eukprot:TRINITY_DN7698_c0_g1_i1.p1 TRINITY_DN7698_c0_g1~~TRINITY_DN7698_c0_g1_i1.p1  ORF type:complete len:596 (-),score=98.04 TRINITY_DN7698_c0_g1_i1:72-1859(-)
MSETKRKREDETWDEQEPQSKRQRTSSSWSPMSWVTAGVVAAYSLTLKIVGVNPETHEDEEEDVAKVPLSPLLQQQTPPPSPISTTQQNWQTPVQKYHENGVLATPKFPETISTPKLSVASTETPKFQLKLVPRTSGGSYIEQHKIEQDMVVERHISSLSRTNSVLNQFQSPKSSPWANRDSFASTSPLASSPGRTPYPHRRRNVPLNLTENRRALFHEGIYNGMEDTQVEYLDEEPDNFYASPIPHRRKTNTMPRTPSTPLAEMYPRTPGSAKKATTVLDKYRNVAEDTFSSPNFQKNRRVLIDLDLDPDLDVNVGTFTKPPKFMETLRSKTEEYKKALDEKKKALEQSRRRDLLVQRVRQEEAVSTLSPQQEKDVQKLFYGPNGDVLVDKFNIEIRREDLCRLKPCVWLNDEISNFFFQLLAERSQNDKTLPKIHVFNTFFYQNLSNRGNGYAYNRVARWTKDKDIFALDKIFIPVHVHGNHWCLAVLNIRDKRIEYYDSMGNSNPKCIENLKKYLLDEHKSKKGEDLDIDTYDVYSPGPDCPQQTNVYDCGVFMCKFADYHSRDLPLTFSQRNIPFFRKQMALQIVNANLDI